MYSTMNAWGQPPPPGTTAYGQNNTAFIPVSAPRQSFGPPLPHPPVPQSPLPPPPAPVEEPPRERISFPQPVRDYVARSFLPEVMSDDVSRDEMEAKLKETITGATDSGKLEILDWEHLPLPQDLVRQDRIRKAGVVASFIPPQPHRDYDSYRGNGFEGTGLEHSRGSRSKKKRKAAQWNSTNTRNGLEDLHIENPSPAKERFDKRQHPFEDDSSQQGVSKFQKTLEKRRNRFDGEYKSSYKRSPSPAPQSGPVVGTSEVLEKRYLRLTAPPIPSQVRPEAVLHQTLELLKKKWKQDGNYPYICDQFKSMRQDLTVQRIKNKFTVSVYEIHARIALEKGDLGEYNQCQTQLRVLYAQNLEGSPVEFKAYRILYLIHTSNRTGLNDVLADLTTAEKEAPPIKHALDVRSSLALGNYHRFFRLYLDTPNMGAYLMDMFVDRERLAALSNICKAYKPDVKLRFITEELAFNSDGDAAQFIFDHNGQHLIEARDGECYNYFLSGKAGALFDVAKDEAFRKVDIKGQI